MFFEAAVTVIEDDSVPKFGILKNEIEYMMCDNELPSKEDLDSLIK